jgi:hypothetical protein
VPTTIGEGRSFLLSWLASERLVPNVRVRNRIVRNQDILMMRFEFSERRCLLVKANAKLGYASK